jgi:RNA polymerase sigma factor (TIGR02999 family)
MHPQDADIDRALAAWRQGDQGAVDDLFRLVYDELRVLAGRHLRHRRPGGTLGPTVLVHEVYLRFAERSSPDLLDRNHFVALVARAMRMVIVDHWRRKQARKRDPQAPVSARLDDVAGPDVLPLIDIFALDEALRRLSELDARQAQVVELRFFGGLTLDEIAAMIGVSERTVKREWQKARAFLYHAMRSTGGEHDV